MLAMKHGKRLKGTGGSMRLLSIANASRHRTRFRGRALAVGASLIGAASVLIAPLSSATAGTKAPASKVCHSANGIRVTDPQVCKGLAFYKGKTMLSYNIASIGGPFYDLVVAEQPYLQQYLGATVNVTSITTGNSVPGQDALAASKPDGLTIGVLNTLNDASLILTKTPGINFNPARMAYLSGSGPSPQPLVVLPSSGYTTWQKVYDAGKAGTLKMLTQTSGTVNTLLRVWMGVLGIHPQWISGYSSLNNETTGLLRGDGPMAVIGLSNSCSYIIGNQFVPVAINNVPVVGTNCRKFVTSVPTWKQMAKTYGKTKAQQRLWQILLDLNSATGTPTVTQTGVAGYKIAALRAALKWTYAQSGFIQTNLTDGISPTYVDPVVAKTDYQNTIKYGQSVVCYIQGTC